MFIAGNRILCGPAPPRNHLRFNTRAMRTAVGALLMLGCGAVAYELDGFSSSVVECAACEVMGAIVQEAMEKDAVAKLLRRDAATRLELIEALCAKLDFAYPRKQTVKGGRELVRFVPLAAGKADDPDEAKVKAVESAKHIGELPDKIVRGKEKNQRLRSHCEGLHVILYKLARRARMCRR